VKLFVIGFLAAVLGADAAEPGKPQNKDGASISVSRTNSTVEKEFQRLEADDDAAQAEVDKWKQENTEARSKGGGVSDTELESRIQARLEPIQKAYQGFLSRNPGHARAHLAYGCFLNERQDETGSRVEWEKALELDPNNAAIYNNLAGSYSEGGPAKKAFDYFNKAIELKPSEAAYYHNFGTTLYVLRKSGMTYYGVDEQQVFAKVLQLYSNALRLDPKNLSFATDLAQTYYSMKPLQIDAALTAWTNALRIAGAETEREGVYIHLARMKMLAGNLAESRALLNLVTNESHAVPKTNLLKAIDAREHSPGEPNAQRTPREEKRQSQSQQQRP
jgi:Tfp pilus assembly protein PilF